MKASSIIQSADCSGDFLGNPCNNPYNCSKFSNRPNTSCTQKQCTLIQAGWPIFTIIVIIIVVTIIIIIIIVIIIIIIIINEILVMNFNAWIINSNVIY